MLILLRLLLRLLLRVFRRQLRLVLAILSFANLLHGVLELVVVHCALRIQEDLLPLALLHPVVLIPRGIPLHVER